jgi:hypothetical protein
LELWTNPAGQDFVVARQNKPQICWHGIVPGFTTRDEAHDLITETHVPELFSEHSGGYINRLCTS